MITISEFDYQVKSNTGKIEHVHIHNLTSQKVINKFFLHNGTKK